MRSKSQMAVPPIQGVIHYRHRQNFFSPRTDRCCFPWMGMSCRSSGQACIRRDSRGCSLPSKNIQDWSRVDTFKLSYHDKSCPPEVTNRSGKAACFGQLMRGQSQASGHAVCCQKVSWQCLQFKESSIIVAGKVSFLPGLIDVAFLGWACHAGHLGRHAFEGIPEDAVCLQKTFKTGVGLTHSS